MKVRTVKKIVTIPLLLITLSVLSAVSVHAFGGSRSELFRAMDDEIRRAMTDLSIGDLPRPYHIEARLMFRRHIGAHAVMGTIEDIDTSSVNTLSVRVRVGTPQFDNTNFFDVSLSFFGSSDDEESFTNRRVPLELDYNTLRRELWLAIDACYKQSVEVYAKKQAAVRNKTRSDTTWDFSFIGADDLIDTSKASLSLSPNYVRSLLESVSSEFRTAKHIQASRVSMEFVPTEFLYVNSEGRRAYKFDAFSGFEMYATTQAPDGMPISDAYAAYSTAPSDLPSEDSLRRAARQMIKQLSTIQNAQKIDAYSGPVLFTGQAAAQIIAQQFAPNLVALRTPLSEGGFSMSGGPGMAFQNKIGARVLPEFLSVKATPQVSSLYNTPVAGNYRVDDEGFASQNVDLVVQGFLKTLLAGRAPTRRVKNTNGHYRNGGAMISVLQLLCEDSTRMYDERRLREQLLKLVRDRELEYGIIVRVVQDRNLASTGLFPLLAGDMPFSSGQGIVSLLHVEKIYADGRTEAIRGVEAAGFSVATFKDILAVGNKPTVHNYLAPAIGNTMLSGGSGYTIATIVTPDLLFEDVEIRPLESDTPNLPLVESPLQ